MTALFIAFEGGDGAGKSTQARLLRDALIERGYEVVMTREPGGSTIAEKIRDVVLDINHVGLDDRSEALLFAAARAEHVAQTVRPALERGAIVITDRYMDSSIAYQGIARDLGLNQIRELNLWATRGLVPHLTVILNVDAERGLDRVADPNRLEEESSEFHQRVCSAFLELAALAPERYLVLEAHADRHAIAAAVLQAVSQRLDAS